MTTGPSLAARSDMAPSIAFLASDEAAYLTGVVLPRRGPCDLTRSAMTASSLLLSRRDLDFLLHDWLDVESLTKRERFADHSRDTFAAVLDLCAEIAAERFGPHNKRNDAEEPQFVNGRVGMHPEVKEALDVVAAAGLIGAGMDAEVGGLQLPQVIQTACHVWFQAANISTWAYSFLTIANANLLLAHGSTEQIDMFVRPMLDGRFHGTMCLSEPQAGSSLADHHDPRRSPARWHLPALWQQDVDFRR